MTMPDGPMQGRPLRILSLPRYTRLGASSRLRTFQFLPALAVSGLQISVQPLFRENYLQRLYAGKKTAWHEVIGDYLARIRALRHAADFDLLWLEKELLPGFPAWLETWLFRSGIPYVVDYDDALFHRYDGLEGTRRSLFPGKIDQVIRHAALVISGNEYLAQHARAAGARRVEILPTVVDLARYAPSVARDRQVLRVGWIGSPATVKYLAGIAPILAAAAQTFPLELRVIGARFQWPGLNIESRPWSEQTEAMELRELDVGIMPLPDAPWERGKCGYKLIQYLASGLPVIASPVGVNREIVKPGVNGFLADSDEAWLDALTFLQRDREASLSMGEAGRQLVDAEYSLETMAPTLARLLIEVVCEGQRVRGDRE